MYTILNGSFCKSNAAAISFNSRGFRYGDGCFETMKYCRGRLVLGQLHFERLFKALSDLQFTWPVDFTPGYLQEQVHLLAKKNDHTKLARIRLTVFRGDGGLFDVSATEVNWLLQSFALDESNNAFNSEGLVTGIFPRGFKAADKFANLKSNNYLLYGQAAMYAQQQGWSDALVLNHRQTVADATIANLFLVQGDKVITSPLTDGPVAGTVRRYLLSQSETFNFQVLERSILPGDLALSQEAFFTNAIYGLRWIRSCGEHVYSNRLGSDIHRQIIRPLFAT